MAFTPQAIAQTLPSLAPDAEFDEILSLDITELTVTSASKRPQRLSDAPAAIYVLTQEDLHRTGITSIPEALRMVPGLEVAQAASNRWEVASRGFNNGLSNKLLVMIDGRSIYTPVFSGTYWDDQAVPIEDIERIEVIRGPGASLWGANAVDGIINIITKQAKDTQGDKLYTGLGTRESYIGGERGGSYGNGGFYRAYTQYHHFGSLETMQNNGNSDDWYRVRSGFRMDGKAAGSDSYTVEGDVYGGRQGTNNVQPTLTPPYMQRFNSTDSSAGGNLLGRWNHKLSSDSDLSVQAYVDHYARDESADNQHVSTGDIQFQNNIRLDGRNNFVWGGGARLYVEELGGSFVDMVNQSFNTHGIVNAFAQDEYALIPNDLYLTLGSKLEYNDYTGFELQPSGRLSWHPVNNQTVWGAVSRAVRTPSSVEDDVSIAARVLPTSPLTVLRAVGNPGQKAETLVAYELGHRIQPTRQLSFDTSVYYNQFHDLLTVGMPGTPFLDSNGTVVVPYQLNNLGSARVYGIEEAVSWQVTNNWRLMGSYSYLNLDFSVSPGTVTNPAGTNGLAPHNQFSARSYLNLTDDVQWDNMLYYVSDITTPAGSYLRYDMRLGWQAMRGLELSLVGQNLLDPSHPEFPATPQAQVGRSVLGQATWTF